ncbi:MAG: PTS sugar transporter subunit IIA [Thermodesulfobacteriota bacterium]
MINAIVITHGELAAQIVKAAKAIVGSAGDVIALGIDESEGADEIRERLNSALKVLKPSGGVIIFTDMFGGTPTNISLPFIEDGAVEIITGVNLPLVIKFLNNRGDYNLKDLATLLLDYGQKSIVRAAALLKGKIQ